MRHFITAFLLMTIFSLHAQSSWQMEKEEDNIRIFTKVIPKSSFKAFRAEATVESKLSAILAVILDIERFPEWSPACTEAYCAKKVANNELINYIVTDAPWPVADRDGTFRFTFRRKPDDEGVQIDIEAVSGIVADKEGHVRIRQSTGYWKLIPLSGNSTKVIYENHTDPEGNIPGWLANSSAVSLPYKTIQNLRKQSKKAQYQQQTVDIIDN